MSGWMLETSSFAALGDITSSVSAEGRANATTTVAPKITPTQAATNLYANTAAFQKDFQTQPTQVHASP
jgi:hypothetical protein